MPLTELALLFAAGALGGMMNTVAGGGTFVTFPALVLVGIPDVSANATATLSALPGYLAGALGFRREVLTIDHRILLRLTLWTLVGSAVGSGLLLVSSDAAFRIAVPFLLLVATSIFLWGDVVRRLAARHSGGVRAFGAGTLLPVTIYGGYFNGGLGIVLLALFSLWGMTNLHQMNGLKTWVAFALSVISGLIFAIGGKIVWAPALVMMAGTALGGYAGAPIARRLPLPILRGLIAAIGFGMTALFFWRLFQ